MGEGGRVGKQLTVLLRDPTQDCLPGRRTALHCNAALAATRDKF